MNQPSHRIFAPAFLLLLLHSVARLSAEECGSILTPADAALVQQLQRQGAYQLPAVAVAGDFPAQIVDLTFHVVRNTDGTGGIPGDVLEQCIIDANVRFADSGIQFCRPGPIRYIDDTSYYTSVDTMSEIDALRQIGQVPFTINIYFTPGLAAFCGISSFTFSPVQGIVMNNSCTPLGGNHSTFPHEIGHYFDVFHTHQSGNECVSGSNCTTAGDLVCDTPADPVLTYLVDTQCNYIGTETGPCVGDPAYAPDTRNLMSYSRKQCRTNFTAGQNQRALATLLNLRSEYRRASCLHEAATLAAYDGSLGDGFGQELAIAGDVIAVGVSGDDEGATLDVGSVRVFRYNGSQWTAEGEAAGSPKLLPIPLQSGMLFGASVSVYGDDLLIGTPQYDVPGEFPILDGGSIFYFRRDSGTTNLWVQQQVVLTTPISDGDHFGSEVALRGSLAVVGAPLDDHDISFVSNTGSASVFTKSGSNWVLQQKLQEASSAAGAQDRLGIAVGIADASTLFAGAAGDVNAGASSGSVIIFRNFLGGWIPTQKLTPSDATNGQEFGSTLAVDEDSLIIGSPGAVNAAGAAYVFRKTSGTWVQEQILAPTIRNPSDRFGTGVYIQGDWAVVTSRMDDSQCTDCGAAILYHYSNGSWAQDRIFYPDSLNTNDQFGIDAAMSGSQIAVGTWLRDQVATNAGVVHVFSMGTDCDRNGWPDDADILVSGEPDCDRNHALDSCQLAWCMLPGSCPDCNLNGVVDACDIANGTSLDANADGRPDECVLFTGGCGANSAWTCSANWDPSGTYPNNVGANHYTPILDGTENVDLDATVVLDGLRVLDNAVLNVTASGASGDLVFAADGVLEIAGSLVVADDRQIQAHGGLVKFSEGGQLVRDPETPLGSVTADLTCGTLEIGPGGRVAGADSMTFAVERDVVLDGTGLGGCVPGAGVAPSLSLADQASLNVLGGELILRESAEFQMSGTTGLMLSDDWVNQSLTPQCFDASAGNIDIFPLANDEMRFEVGGEDVGPSQLGFFHPTDGHGNFSVNSLRVNDYGENSAVRFVNVFSNTVGSVGCDEGECDEANSLGCTEALYVRELVFEASTTPIILDNCRVYYGTLVTQGAQVLTIGCGALVQVPMCAQSQECLDERVCTHDKCNGVEGRCEHTIVSYGNVDGSRNQQPNLDDILCLLAGFANFSACPNGDIHPPCTGDNSISLDDILKVLAAFAGTDPCGC